MIYDAARVRRLYIKFQVNMSKKEKKKGGGIFHLGGGGWGWGLDCGQYQILTDPHNGLKNLCRHFGYDLSHRLGGV